jgi:hypothetical protein
MRRQSGRGGREEDVISKGMRDGISKEMVKCREVLGRPVRTKLLVRRGNIVSTMPVGESFIYGLSL